MANPTVFESTTQNIAAVVGENKADGDGVVGIGHGASGRGVVGISQGQNGVTGIQRSPDGRGAGVYGETFGPGEGVHGVSHSLFAGVTGFNDGREPMGPGVWGHSENGEGVHGETRSPVFAAVAGINEDAGAGVYGKSALAAAGFFDGNVIVTGNLSVSGITIGQLLGRIANLERQVAGLAGR
jgi:hypothetical protein